MYDMAVDIGNLSCIQVLGTRIHVVHIPEIIEIMIQWIESKNKKCHQIVNTGMHGVMEAHRDPEFKSILNSVDLMAPDGILVALTSRLKGHPIKKENTGPGLMWKFSEYADKKEYKYFLYGDTEETLKQLTVKLTEEFPGIRLVGAHSPPFRSLTDEEDKLLVSEINHANPDVLWVALGTPKQDRWIFEHLERLEVPVAIGVGAAFKYTAGIMDRSPMWLSRLGFEWLWRLIHEPKRVWRRIFIDAPQFMFLVAMELFRVSKSS